MIKVFAGKVRKTGFFQKTGFPGNSERIFGIYYNQCPGDDPDAQSEPEPAVSPHL
jgi:hypothetical protein